MAAEPTLLFRVDQNTFRYILQSQTQQSQREKVELLQKVDFLKHLDDADLRKMTRVMTPRVYRKDEVIVRKGDHGDAFYILAEGNVLVKDISVGCTVYQDQTLGPGEYFGERALATSEPRAANVVGLTKGVAFSIDRATFEKVLGTMSHLVLKAQDARRLAGVKVLAPLRLDALQFAALAANIEDRRYNAGQQIVTLGLVTPSALYFVREGRVEVNVNGQLDHVDAGGYFGEPSFGSQPNPVATYSATASVDSVCGVLTLMDCRDVFDVSLLQGKERVARSTSAAAFVPETKVRLDELERHAILGEGTFGQVQLVSERLSDGSRRPYALKIQAKADLESVRLNTVPSGTSLCENGCSYLFFLLLCRFLASGGSNRSRHSRKGNHEPAESSLLGSPRQNIPRRVLCVHPLAAVARRGTVQRPARSRRAGDARIAGQLLCVVRCRCSGVASFNKSGVSRFETGKCAH